MASSQRYKVSDDGERAVNTHTGRPVALPKGVRERVGSTAEGKVGHKEAVRDFVAEKNYR
jgi:hypothetical protein